MHVVKALILSHDFISKTLSSTYTSNTSKIVQQLQPPQSPQVPQGSAWTTTTTPAAPTVTATLTGTASNVPSGNGSKSNADAAAYYDCYQLATSEIGASVGWCAVHIVGFVCLDWNRCLEVAKWDRGLFTLVVRFDNGQWIMGKEIFSAAVEKSSEAWRPLYVYVNNAINRRRKTHNVPIQS